MGLFDAKVDTTALERLSFVIDPVAKVLVLRKRLALAMPTRCGTGCRADLS